MKTALRSAAVGLFALAFSAAAFGQWSSDPSVNLALANNPNGSDQVQPKLVPTKNYGWYVSWFDSNPFSPPPVGYDVFYQRLSKYGVEQFRHDGQHVAKLSNSSTEDYGLDVDNQGNALLTFLDTREGANQQITAAKMSPSGKALWGGLGVQLTNDNNSNNSPKIAATSDGGIVVAWGSNSNVVLQKLNAAGQPQWGSGVVFSESGYNYYLADLHAADNGSVIVSWVREQGFGSNAQLRANKVAADGSLLWGSSNVDIFDVGSLQFGNFPYFLYDGNGGAVFDWYTSSPTLQCFAQHILADGSEAFPHNGSAVSTNTSNVRVSPSAAYRKDTQEIFVFWTEEDSLQTVNGVYGQKFDSTGTAQWGATGLVIVPLGSDSQIFVTTVQSGTGALTFWVDQPSYGSGTIQAIKLDGSGGTVCSQFAVSSVSADKSRLVAGMSSNGITALAFEDDRLGNNGIYIQNVNPDCSLGKP
ncbi:MAG TPA: hypothetical protein VGS27_08265 [Candidatus Sulfotelmatobacter sp.]|nr:hypothetical protein [Candidatus Sulfotelmatobacter sp.]